MTAYFIDLLLQLVTATVTAIGYPGIFLLMVADSTFTPVPSELVMPFSGYLASTGYFSLPWVIVMGVLGNTVGALISYAIGYYGGRPFVLRYGRYFFVKEHEVHRAEAFFERWGAFAIILSRNIPFLRMFISLPAGIAEMNLGRFIFDTFIGSIPWSFTLAYLGYSFGSNWLNIRHYSGTLDLISLLCLLAFVAKLVYDYYHDKSAK